MTANSKAGEDLKFLPIGGAITAQVKTLLKEIFKDDDTNALAGKTPRELFDRLEGGGFNPDDHDFLAIASALINYLQGAGYGSQQGASQPNLSKEGGEGGFTTKLVGALGEFVHGRRALHEFTWRELLDLLIANDFGKFEKSEVIAAFKATTVVAAALRKAQGTNGAIIVLKDDKSVDKSKTVKYISDLHNKAFMRATEEFESLGTYTVEYAFGQHHMVTINLFTGEVEYIGTVNQFGVDPGVLIERFPKRAQMVLWGFVTGHEAVRDLSTNKYAIGDYYQQLQSEKLTSPRWIDLEKSYNRAIERGDLSENDFRLRMTEEQALRMQARYRGASAVRVDVQVQQPTEPVKDENYYRRLLEEQAALNPETLTLSGTGQDHRGGVFDFIKISGTGCDVRNVIVLKGGRVSGTGCDVSGFTAPRVSVSCTGTGSSVRLTPKSYKDLCRHLGIA